MLRCPSIRSSSSTCAVALPVVSPTCTRSVLFIATSPLATFSCCPAALPTLLAFRRPFATSQLGLLPSSQTLACRAPFRGVVPRAPARKFGHGRCGGWHPRRSWTIGTRGSPTSTPSALPCGKLAHVAIFRTAVRWRTTLLFAECLPKAFAPAGRSASPPASLASPSCAGPKNRLGVSPQRAPPTSSTHDLPTVPDAKDKTTQRQSRQGRPRARRRYLSTGTLPVRRRLDRLGQGCLVRKRHDHGRDGLLVGCPGKVGGSVTLGILQRVRYAGAQQRHQERTALPPNRLVQQGVARAAPHDSHRRTARQQVKDNGNGHHVHGEAQHDGGDAVVVVDGRVAAGTQEQAHRLGRRSRDRRVQRRLPLRRPAVDVKAVHAVQPPAEGERLRLGRRLMQQRWAGRVGTAGRAGREEGVRARARLEQPHRLAHAAQQLVRQARVGHRHFEGGATRLRVGDHRHLHRVFEGAASRGQRRLVNRRRGQLPHDEQQLGRRGGQRVGRPRTAVTTTASARRAGARRAARRGSA
mmetsp:Transcript_921/g.2805  ORF Transcript_921/g.2805 Transcript_921/m.2805 type:complete len:524 (-) Transcript_921:2237-3808(-)